jgi:hypothetical protein
MALKLEVFRRRRGRLNQDLVETREEVDAWIVGLSTPASIPELTRLEVLLADRREVLQELIDLDDRFMNDLAASR